MDDGADATVDDGAGGCDGLSTKILKLGTVPPACADVDAVPAADGGGRGAREDSALRLGLRSLRC